jgi:hypothetical protein
MDMWRSEAERIRAFQAIIAAGRQRREADGLADTEMELPKMVEQAPRGHI